MPVTGIQRSTASGITDVASFFVRELSSGLATTGDPSVPAETKGNTNEIQDALDYILNMMRLPTFSTSAASDGTIWNCSCPSSKIPGTVGEPGGIVDSKGDAITASTDRASDPSLAASGDTESAGQNETACENPLLVAKVLASALADLRAALEGQLPHENLAALLEVYRAKANKVVQEAARDRYDPLVGLTEKKWEEIIKDVCDSPEDACKILGDPDFKAAVLVFIKEELRKLKAVEFDNRFETGSTTKSGTIGPRASKAVPDVTIAAIVLNSILAAIVISLLILFLWLYLAKRRREQRAQEERSRPQEEGGSSEGRHGQTPAIEFQDFDVSRHS